MTFAYCPGAAAQTLTLTLGGTALHFPSANPSTTPSIPATESPITISVGALGLGTWTVTLIAAGDLQSGTDTIPISNIHWTSTGAAFRSGTVSKILPQILGVSLLGGGGASGTLLFTLDNSWSYPVGIYSQTILLTVLSL